VCNLRCIRMHLGCAVTKLDLHAIEIYLVRDYSEDSNKGGSSTMSAMARRVAAFGTTVFVEINDLARQCKAVNLGQGAPDFDGPPEVLAAGGGSD
jgi:hypothetical protein